MSEPSQTADLVGYVCKDCGWEWSFDWCPDEEECNNCGGKMMSHNGRSEA
jgi:DNA-directed RNA polymerase subunit RPC12/RpoP